MIKHYNSYQIFSLLILFIYLSASVQGQDWERLNDTPFLKHHSNGFGFGDKAYVFEGTFGDDGPNGVSNEVWEYDAPSDTWTRIEDFPGPGRAISIGDELDGKYYHGFGRGASGFLNDLWVYAPGSSPPPPACQTASARYRPPHNSPSPAGTGCYRSAA